MDENHLAYKKHSRLSQARLVVFLIFFIVNTNVKALFFKFYIGCLFLFISEFVLTQSERKRFSDFVSTLCEICPVLRTLERLLM